MNMAGFTAESSIHSASGHYHMSVRTFGRVDGVIYLAQDCFGDCMADCLSQGGFDYECRQMCRNACGPGHQVCSSPEMDCGTEVQGGFLNRVCCPSGTNCCNETYFTTHLCCPPDKICCALGHSCCVPGEQCTTEGCCQPNRVCGNHCCESGVFCSPIDSCCNSGDSLCPPGNGCCPHDAICTVEGCCRPPAHATNEHCCQDPETQWIAGECRQCGKVGQIPCGNGCKDGLRLNNGLCAVCGDEGQIPCDGMTCKSNLNLNIDMLSNKLICTASCGHFHQYACRTIYPVSGGVQSRYRCFNHSMLFATGPADPSNCLCVPNAINDRENDVSDNSGFCISTFPGQGDIPEPPDCEPDPETGSC